MGLPAFLDFAPGLVPKRETEKDPATAPRGGSQFREAEQDGPRHQHHGESEERLSAYLIKGYPCSVHRSIGNDEVARRAFSRPMFSSHPGSRPAW